MQPYTTLCKWNVSESLNETRKKKLHGGIFPKLSIPYYTHEIGPSTMEGPGGGFLPAQGILRLC